MSCNQIYNTMPIRLPVDAERFNEVCLSGNVQEAEEMLQTRAFCLIKPDLFIKKCLSGDLPMAQFLFKNQPGLIHHISHEHEFLFRQICCNGQLEIAKWLLLIKPDINVSDFDEYAFRFACMNGHLSVAQWLMEIKPNINVLAQAGFAFVYSCVKGHLNVAQWLLSLMSNYLSYVRMAFINVCRTNKTTVIPWLLDIAYPLGASDDIDHAFEYACEHQHVNVAQLLSNYCGERLVLNVQHGIIVEYSINLIQIANEITVDVNELDSCPVCCENIVNVQTNCKHQFCESCIRTCLKQKHTCPYCRQLLTSLSKLVNRVDP